MKSKSLLQKKRLDYKPKVPDILNDITNIEPDMGKKIDPIEEKSKLKEIFKEGIDKPLIRFKKGKGKGFPKLKVGVVFSGGQAAGGHNVISGLFDCLKKINKDCRLIGFLDGPSGIIDGRQIEITQDLLLAYRNQGGFDLIGSGRGKIETEEQFSLALKNLLDLRLDGLVVIGGDDSNTNAALLAEYLLEKKCETKVIGVPKTIDGDLKTEHIEISFGFDTACKVYSEMIGNIAIDALSAKKYYHFIRLMGRSASHIALECALSTHANLTLIGEQIKKSKKTLSQIVAEIADLVEERAKKQKNYGVILIPEGIIEFIFEFEKLIQELNALLAKGPDIMDKLSAESKECLSFLPQTIKEQLLLDRDPHGNVKVSQIETEKLLIELVEKELKKRSAKTSFNALSHFFGYEGRCSLPSNFDCNYCYSLGHIAALLIKEGATGYICAIGNAGKNPRDWELKGAPLSSMINLEERKGKKKPVIKKALVDLEGRAFLHFAKEMVGWRLDDDYVSPGPIQFFDEEKITDSVPITITL